MLASGVKALGLRIPLHRDDLKSPFCPASIHKTFDLPQLLYERHAIAPLQLAHHGAGRIQQLCCSKQLNGATELFPPHVRR
jgi:hypothetical protein